MSATAPQTSTDHNENLTFIIQKEPLQQAIDQLKTIVDEAIFHIGRDGLHVAAVDPGNVGMVNIDLSEEAFEHAGSGSVVLGVDLGSLDDYLSAAGGDDLVQLAYDESKRYLNIQHTQVDVDMAGIDPDAVRAEPDTPDIDLDVSVTLEARDLKQAVDHADLASDHVYFTADGDEGELRAVGSGDTDTVQITFEHDDMIEGSFPDGETVAIFSIDYLNAGGSKTGGLLNPIPDDAEATARFDDEHPLKVHYEFADGHGEATLQLAPRITSE